MTSSPRLRDALAGLAAAALGAVAVVALGSPRVGHRDGVTLARDSAAALADGHVSRARDLASAAVADDAASAVAQLALAHAALAQEDGVSAEAAVKAARAAGADGPATEHLYAQARLLQGDPAGAIAHAADATEHADALRTVALAQAANGDPVAAEASFAEALRLSPRDAATWAALSDFRASIDDDAGAWDASVQAVIADDRAPAALVARAHSATVREGLVAALPWYERALVRDPDYYPALIGYAAALGDAGRPEAMLAATRRALSARPGDPQALYLLAVLAARADRPELARAMLQKAGDTLAGEPGQLMLGATLDLDAGGNQQAVSKLRNLIAIQPLNVAARQLLALALARSGAARDALDVLRPAALRDDADSYTLTLAARIFETIGDRETAATLLDRAAASARAAPASFSADDSIDVLAAATLERPAGDPTTTVPLIRARIDAGTPGEALDDAARVARANPGSARAAFALSDTAMALGRPRLALAPLRRAAAARLDEPTMLRLVEVFERVGNVAAADTVLARVAAERPADAAASRLLARRAIARGDGATALRLLERLRRSGGGRDAALLADLATAYAMTGNVAAARDCAAVAYRLAPSNPAVVDVYGRILHAGGERDGALQLLQKAVTLAPREATVRLHLAQLYADLGRMREARFHAAAALSDPRFGDRAAATAIVNRAG